MSGAPSVRDLPEVDERLLWMLRVLADEFGQLGVLQTCVELWPDATTGLLARALTGATGSPTPKESP